MYSQFQSIKQQFQRRLYSYAYYSLHDPDDAEDIVQEAFAKLWENRRNVDLPQAGGWLMRVTQNLIVDHLRRHNSRPPESGIDANLLAREDGPETDRRQQEILKRIVEQSIAVLNDPYRTTLIMREIQGLSYREIADTLCVSVEHVKTDLFRGKRKLRGIVRQHPLYHHDLLTD